MPGPVPKRSEVRRRRNTDGGKIDRAPAARNVARPDADDDWHPVAKRWYNALGESGQAVFYEPSDWAHAYFVAEAMSRLLAAGRFSAQLFAAVDSAAAKLLTTEGDRRRLRLELERHEQVDVDEDAAVASLDEWRERLASG